MATPTKEELQAMADAMTAMDKKLITDLEALITGFENSVKTVLAALPDSPMPNTPAFMFAARLKGLLTANTQYELQTIRAQYGIGSSTTLTP